MIKVGYFARVPFVFGLSAMQRHVPKLALNRLHNYVTSALFIILALYVSTEVGRRQVLFMYRHHETSTEKSINGSRKL
jgi:hypothetical protein